MDITIEQLKTCPLFSGISQEELEYITDKSKGACEETWYKNHSMIAQRGIYVIRSGRIRVCKKEGDKEIFLTYLISGDSFGYTNLFSNAQYKQVTLLFAKEKTETLFIPEERVMEVIYKIPKFAINIIAIQSEKVRFLNKKIDSFTSPTAESRLMKYLSSCGTEEDGKVIIGESMAELARRLDMGRASLYRSFESLEKNGDILKKDGHIYILRNKNI